MDRRHFLHQIGRAAATLGVTTASGAAFAQEKSISARHITVGTSLPLTGVLARAGLEHRAGIRAAFATVNNAGGVYGRELRLDARDDAYKPAQSVQNVRSMLDEGLAFAFVSLVGTGNTAAVIPLLEQAGAPLVGPITGASSVRRAEHQNIFHIRPGYAEEVHRMVQQITDMGLSNIAIVYLDNAFGREVLADAQRAVTQARVSTAGNFALAMDGSTAADAAQQVVDTKAGAVFIAATGTGVTDFVIELRQRAFALPVVGMSVSFTDLQRLGPERAAGLAMANVFPDPKSTRFALVRAYNAAMAATNTEVSVGSAALESWVNAQVLIEGIRRAGRDITRDKLRAALTGIRDWRINELAIDMTPAAPHTGKLAVNLAVMGQDFRVRV
jgi:branched-chain amino acid transport system substrate-binding protein